MRSSMRPRPLLPDRLGALPRLHGDPPAAAGRARPALTIWAIPSPEILEPTLSGSGPPSTPRREKNHASSGTTHDHEGERTPDHAVGGSRRRRRRAGRNRRPDAEAT